MKVRCPFEDTCNDFCCWVAAHGKESFEECYECALKMSKAIADFVIELIKKRQEK